MYPHINDNIKYTWLKKTCCIFSNVLNIVHLQVLKFRLESTDLPDIGTPADALQETILYRAYTMALDTYSKQLSKVSALQI